MRSILKTATLESRFPLLGVERGFILSKGGDVTAAWAVELPELFTLTEAEEYEVAAGHMSSRRSACCRTTPSFISRTGSPKSDTGAGPGRRPPFGLSPAPYERHFNERPYLQHSVLPVHHQDDARSSMRSQSNFSTVLCRSRIVPQEMRRPAGRGRASPEAAYRRPKASSTESGHAQACRAAYGSEGDHRHAGRGRDCSRSYFTLSSRTGRSNEDIRLDPGAHDVSATRYLCAAHAHRPGRRSRRAVATDARYERLSTDRSGLPPERSQPPWGCCSPAAMSTIR